MTDDQTAARRALIMQRLTAAANRVAPSIRPLIGISPRQRPEVVGSSVLVRIADRRLLFTAGHVLDEFENRAAFLDLNGVLLPLSGQFRSSRSPPEGRDADRIDFAYMALSDEIIAKIPDRWYLGVEQLARDERPRYESPGRTAYLVAGYPSSRMRVNPHQGTYDARPMPLGTVVATGEVHAALGLDTDRQIALEFDRNAMVRRGQPAVGPEPYGVSGGGVFRFDSLSATPHTIDRLVGIVVSWRKQPPLCLIATRVEELLAPISLEFPETWPHIRDMNRAGGDLR